MTFDSTAGWSLFELVHMQDERACILDRKVDLLEEAALRNPYRRSTILRSKHVLYAAEERDPGYVWDMLDAPRPD